MEACPDRRAQFKQIIANLPEESLVYIDESGIDSTDRKKRGWGKRDQVLAGKRAASVIKG